MTLNNPIRTGLCQPPGTRLTIHTRKGFVMKNYNLYEDEIMESAENEYLTPKEVMNLLYIGRNTFYKLVNSGELPAFRIGKQWRVQKSALSAYFAVNS